ncbi:LysM peptidoglycan-binding domain-containing protein [Priestia filamentosa]|uniref:LysM peptidoglycan-binding domain-containing protein n=1 Tax=Priestia filamentosa TaxID=1402861 RepID=UPI001FB27226|nr:LysM peptidoglycan-binding domain-containing protein [Priestia filamentosa]UOE61258.1 LysM peptidoglycan-binding domain-containing protein [Priestia filamentosa]
MSKDNLSCLRFSVEESVYFRSDQEVDQLLSISLSPDVATNELGDQVSIYGALMLVGEYVQKEGESSIRDQAEGRMIEAIELREDGITTFAHRFPIDITIPRDRISSLEELYVDVESFDYDLFDQRSLKLTADICIIGIEDATAEPQQSAPQDEGSLEEESKLDDELVYEPLYRSAPSEEEVEKEEDEWTERITNSSRSIQNPYQFPEDEREEEEEDISEIEEPFEVEVKREKTEEKEEAPVFEPLQLSKEDSPSEENNIAEPHQERPVSSEKVEEKKETVESSSPAAVTSVREEVETKELETTHRKDNALYLADLDEERPLSEADLLEKVEEKEEVESSSPTVVTSTREEDEPKEPKAHRKENTLYLTELFDRDEQETKTCVKMCIVQEGDSLEQIAGRYDLPVHQLVQANNLEDEQDVTEGQVLTIPV